MLTFTVKIAIEMTAKSFHEISDKRRVYLIYIFLRKLSAEFEYNIEVVNPG